jgi:glycosyltransferase involved in cell wall biosynthesis
MAPKRPPKVSCLLITADRDAFAQCAIDCYESQTYPHKELVIVDSGVKPLNLTGRLPVTYQRVTSKLSLGELRNLALSIADGEYFIQWDDDDYSSPSRIQIQYEHARGRCASVFRRVTLLWPARQYSAISKPRFWEATLMARRDLNLSFPALCHAEDTPVIESMIRSRVPFGIIDQPELYYYIFHGSNTSTPQHFAKLCAYPSVVPIRFRDSFRKLPANLKRLLIPPAGVLRT